MNKKQALQIRDKNKQRLKQKFKEIKEYIARKNREIQDINEVVLGGSTKVMNGVPATDESPSEMVKFGAERNVNVKKRFLTFRLTNEI